MKVKDWLKLDISEWIKERSRDDSYEWVRVDVYDEEGKFVTHKHYPTYKDMLDSVGESEVLNVTKRKECMHVPYILNIRDIK